MAMLMFTNHCPAIDDADPRPFTSASSSSPLPAAESAVRWAHTLTDGYADAHEPLLCSLTDLSDPRPFTRRRTAASAASSSTPLPAAPSAVQGHGRVTLNEGLNVDGIVGIFFKDWETLVQGQTVRKHVYRDTTFLRPRFGVITWAAPRHTMT